MKSFGKKKHKKIKTSRISNLLATKSTDDADYDEYKYNPEKYDDDKGVEGGERSAWYHIKKVSSNVNNS